MKSFAKYFVFLILPVTIVVLWLAGAFHHRLSAKEVEKPSKVVEGLRVEEVKVMDKTYVDYAGTVVPSDRAEISTRNMGYVSHIAVKEGDYVRKGDLLIRIDQRDTRAQVSAVREQVRQAEQRYASALANYTAIKKTYERYKNLLQEQAITQHEFDMVEAQYRSAKAQLEMAKSGIEMAKQHLKAVSTNLSYTEIRAPFSGYVVSKLADEGDIAKPGYPLLIMEKPPYQVEFNLPERLLGKVKKGEKVRIYIPSLKKTAYAVIREIEPSVNPMSRTFKVKALIKDKEIKGGLFARVFVEEKTKKTLLVPQSAIYKRWDFTGVWVVKEDGTLSLRFVRLGRRIGDQVEVLSGLKEGDRVVVKGLEKACEGCKVGG